MNSTGAVVVAVAVLILVISAVVARRLRGRVPVIELLFAHAQPLLLGGHTVVRCTMPAPSEETWALRAALVCDEMVPAAAAEVQVTRARSIDCRCTVLTATPTLIAEIDLDVPLDASPSMDFAGHRIEWTLVVEVVGAAGPCPSVRQGVVVAAAIAPQRLDGEMRV
jgi:hypothetical protein